MDKSPQKTAFSMKDLQRAEIATKDNVERRPPPPIHIQHPRLAPTGSVGVRLNQTPPPIQKAQTPAQRPTLNREFGKPSDVHKEFKGIAGKTLAKGLER